MRNSNSDDDDVTIMTDQHPIFNGFQVHGWIPDPTLSENENYMDMIMLLTRNSKCRQGHMACALVRPEESDPSSSSSLLDRIVTIANNTSVYREFDSDNHAEINAICEAAKTGKATIGCTIFITMPPCKRCFGAIIAAGIRRIVSTRTVLEPIATISKDRKVELVVMDATASNARIAKFFPKPSQDQLDKSRTQREQERRDRQLIARDRKRKAQEGL